ncbi:MAG: hypothetical protein GXP45_00645 [bacterium]|nr:hypothetical protein [bacterium]
MVAIDAKQSQLTDLLSQKGISVIIGHGNYDVKMGDIVIYSSAVKDSPEVQHLILTSVSSWT